MTSIEEKFHEKRFYQPLFPGMWFNQRELSLPEGIYQIEILVKTFMKK